MLFSLTSFSIISRSRATFLLRCSSVIRGGGRAGGGSRLPRLSRKTLGGGQRSHMRYSARNARRTRSASSCSFQFTDRLSIAASHTSSVSVTLSSAGAPDSRRAISPCRPRAISRSSHFSTTRAILQGGDRRQGLGWRLGQRRARLASGHHLAGLRTPVADHLVEPAVALERKSQATGIAGGDRLFDRPHPRFQRRVMDLAVAADPLGLQIGRA